MQISGINSLIRQHPSWCAVVASFIATAIWIYWPVFGDMANKWIYDPQYSHGYLVPVFALVLLYLKRSHLENAEAQINWRGLPLIALGGFFLVTAAYINFDYLAAASFLPVASGLFLLFGGWPAFRWSLPAVAFLIFMIPLPFSVEHALGHPLQRVATIGSTWTLQTLGFPAFGEGNVIVMEKGRIAVVEACSGLSMLLTFAAITTGMAILIKRPLMDRIVVVLSTLPISLIVNIVRITANGVAMDVWDAEVAHELFHDQAGWMMMPLAIALVYLEIWILSCLFVEVETEEMDFVPGMTGAPRPTPKPKTAAGPLT
jgi:exosortase